MTPSAHDAEEPAGPPPAGSAPRPDVDPAAAATGLAADAAHARDWEALLRALSRRGVTVVLAMIPDGGRAGVEETRLARSLARRLDLPYLDLRAADGASELTYSDGTHLIESSARRVSDALNRSLRAMASASL